MRCVGSQQCRIIGEIFFHNGLHRSKIASFPYLGPSAPKPGTNIVWFQSNDAVEDRQGLSIVPQIPVSDRGVCENPNASRIQLHCTLVVTHGIVPTVLTTVDVSTQFRNSCIVGQGACCDSQLITGSVVIEVVVVKMISQGKVCFA